WAYFAVGVFFSVVALVVMVWGFALGSLTQDRRWLIRGLFPVASGFAAGAFTGRAWAKGKTRGLLPGFVVFITGGFAVWLLTHFVWKEPQPVPEETRTLSGRLVDHGQAPLAGVALSTREE